MIYTTFLLCTVVSIHNVLSDSSYGYEVFRFSPRTRREVDTIADIEKFLPYEHDFLRRARSVGQKGALLVRREAVNATNQYFTENGIEFQRVEPRLPEVNARRVKRFVKPSSGIGGQRTVDVDLSRYLEHDEQLNFIDAVADRYPDFVSSGLLGKSSEGKEIKYLTIGYPRITAKPALFIDAGIHAREWIAPATALWIVNELTNSTRYRSLLQNLDIIIAPNLNPDGYTFSRHKDPMWRKNRQPYANCFGVDLNRNFPYMYGASGVSEYPCSEIYKGPYAVSEREAYHLKKYLDENKDRIKSYLTLHSFGQNWVYPWGYKSRTYPPDVQDLINLGRRAVSAIASFRGTRYKVANSADGMYPAAGASDDYAKSLGIKYVYTIELSPSESDPDGFEFALPENHILPTAQEVFRGILVVAQEVAKM